MPLIDLVVKERRNRNDKAAIIVLQVRKLIIGLVNLVITLRIIKAVKI